MRVSMSPKAMVKLQRWRMVFLAELGLSHRGIAKILMISQCAIANTLKKYQKAGSVADLPWSGRPWKTALRQDCRIVRMSLKNRKNTAVDLRREINSELSKPDEKISESTVRNRLKEANLNGRVARKKPYLRTVNKKKRLQSAKEHEHWTVEDWKKVVWSDESSFTLFRTTGRTWVRRRPGEEYKEECLQPTIKHSGGKIQVWGSFMDGQTSKLFWIKEIMNKEVYKKILRFQFLPAIKAFAEKRGEIDQVYIEQDNDPKHTAHVCAAAFLRYFPKRLS